MKLTKNRRFTETRNEYDEEFDAQNPDYMDYEIEEEDAGDMDDSVYYDLDVDDEVDFLSKIDDFDDDSTAWDEFLDPTDADLDAQEDKYYKGLLDDEDLGTEEEHDLNESIAIRKAHQRHIIEKRESELWDGFLDVNNKSSKLNEAVIAGPNGLQYSGRGIYGKHQCADKLLSKLGYDQYLD